MVNEHEQVARICNIRRLIQQEGSALALGKRLRVSAQYLYQVLDQRLPLSDTMARHIELRMQLEPGALDIQTDLVDDADVPMLSLNQRIQTSIRAVQRLNGEKIALTRTKITPQTRDALVDAILDNLEQLAQNRQISLLPQHKAVLFRLAVKRLLDQGEQPSAQSA